MTTTSEVEQTLKRALRLLYSSHPNSATEMRQMLDEAIKQRYGPEKMLCNTLSKRHLDLEKTFPGRAATPVPQEPVDEIINLTHSPTKTISDSPDTIVDSEDAQSGAGGAEVLTAGDDDGNLKEFGDLNCCVCDEIMFTASNRLIECSKCGSLYHQECHKPPITKEEASEDQEHNWQCDSCFNKPSTSKAAGIIVIPDEPISLASKTKTSTASSHSSSSSNSSSPFYKLDQASSSSVTTTTTSSSKHSRKSSPSSSRSHKDERSSHYSKITTTIGGTSVKTSSHSSSSRKSSYSSDFSSKSSSLKSSKHHDKRKNK